MHPARRDTGGRAPVRAVPAGLDGVDAWRERGVALLLRRTVGGKPVEVLDHGADVFPRKRGYGRLVRGRCEPSHEAAVAFVGRAGGGGHEERADLEDIACRLLDHRLIPLQTCAEMSDRIA